MVICFRRRDKTGQLSVYLRCIRMWCDSRLLLDAPDNVVDMYYKKKALESFDHCVDQANVSLSKHMSLFLF